MPNAQLTTEQVHDEAEKLFREQAKPIIATSDKPRKVHPSEKLLHKPTPSPFKTDAN